MRLFWLLNIYPDFSNPVFSMFYPCPHPFLFYLKLKRVIYSLPCGLKSLPFYHNHPVDGCPKLRHGVTMLRRGSLGQPLALLHRSLRLCSFPTSVKSYLWRWLVWKFLIMTSNFDLAPSLVQNILTFVNLFTPHHSERSFRDLTRQINFGLKKT